MISWKQLQQVVKKAESRFRSIQAAYPALPMYPVFCSEQGQTDLYSTPLRIMQEFPAMIDDAPDLEQTLQLARRIKDVEYAMRVAGGMPLRKLPNKFEALERLKNELAQAYAKVKECIPQLGVKEHVHVEIRFIQLNYKLIWQLQADPLIDRARTPRSRASIRIVLGALEELLTKQIVESADEDIQVLQDADCYCAV